MSAAVTNRKTTENKERRILFIRELEIVKIKPMKESRFRLKITSGDERKKTEVIKINTISFLPKWTQHLTFNFNPQAVVLWELHGRRWMSPHFKVLGSAQKTFGELFEGNNDRILKVSFQLDSPSNVMMAVVPEIEKPSESSKFLDPSNLQIVFDTTKTMIDALAGVHPAATIAWGFLSIGFKILENRCDLEDAICNLYKDMISAYEEFSEDDILKDRDRLQGIYDSLFKQTIECALFIEGYANKSMIGHLVTMDISDRAEKFSHVFADLKSQLSKEYAREAIIVTLGVQKNVDILIMRDRLRDLHPPQELGPKSRCMQGTCVVTINNIVSWIAQCDGKVMWCNGLAGTGKSSLMGTFHNLLTMDFGGRSRLVAFSLAGGQGQADFVGPNPGP
ncbi:hypothetical protein EDD18DRAFT_1470562 [Armillaria luteobubalina]|uniref:Uncharacterized protein n=1 Tax=Armillaria luteobubalina TaxID=153913 RepID=A0AA39NZS7_9AGAR|nr:hypothetical protein EDD18DRAFT_1470562 [Armillaria luteobubalina]